MKTKPIIFSGPMVRAILDGRKTQTRRIVKPRSYICDVEHGIPFEMTEDGPQSILSPCQPGDLLWVREKFAHGWHHAQPNYLYAATDSVGNSPDFDGWKPSIHMPREASRITLEVTAVRCERLQDISEADAIAEGIRRQRTDGYGHVWYGASEEFEIDKKGNPISGLDYVSAFRNLWQSIHGPESWSLNPWVWVYEFRRVKP